MYIHINMISYTDMYNNMDTTHIKRHTYIDQNLFHRIHLCDHATPVQSKISPSPPVTHKASCCLHNSFAALLALFSFGEEKTRCSTDDSELLFDTPQKPNINPKNKGFQVRNLLLQKSMFRCQVKYQVETNVTK